MAELAIKGLSKSFGEVGVIHNIDLHINDGEFVVFVGPSGCGKSTLLRMIAGLEDATSGLIEIEGKDVTKLNPADRSVAMVFQSYALYPHMNVYDNMAFGLKMMGTPKQEIDALVTKAAGILQLETLLKRKPRQLSGGQRQRVAIGRAIVREPKIFLFDEPLSNLDAELRVDMRLELAKLHQDLKATMIYVTHDQVEAMTLADKIVVLRAGRVEQIGAPLELYHNPCNMFVAGFIGAPRMNFIKANLTKIKDNNYMVHGKDYPNLKYEINLDDKTIPSNQEVMLGIRPEDFSQDGAIKIDIICDTIEHLGHASFAYTKVNSSSALTIKFNPELSVKIKGNLTSYIDKHKIYVFDPLTGLRIRESVN